LKIDAAYHAGSRSALLYKIRLAGTPAFWGDTNQGYFASW